MWSAGSLLPSHHPPSLQRVPQGPSHHASCGSDPGDGKMRGQTPGRPEEGRREAWM